MGKQSETIYYPLELIQRTIVSPFDAVPSNRPLFAPTPTWERIERTERWSSAMPSSRIAPSAEPQKATRTT